MPLILLLFAGVYGFRFIDTNGADAVLVLFVVPIALSAIAYGLRGGLAASTLALLLLGLWPFLADQAFGFFGYLSRSSAFLVVGGLVGHFADQRRALEDSLRRHWQLSLDVVCTASFDGFFTEVNPAFVRLLGYSEEELLSRPLLEFIHPDDRQATLAEVKRQSEAGEEVLNFKNRYQRRDGSYCWLEWTSRPDPKAKRLVAAARDISLRKQAEETIQHQHELLEQAVKDRTRELEDARYETLAKLALAAEFRDDETHEHTERVGRMVALLAERLGLSTDEIALLRQAAPLHDLGKLSVSDTILLKPGKLSTEEYEQMKTHANVGAAILAGSSSDVLRLAEEIARTHHEWWDGSGYPAGLRGEAIPLSGRIVALADVFDALTHARPYKQAWSVEATAAEIRRLNGRQFDPEIVAAFGELDVKALTALAGHPQLQALAS